LPTIEEARAKNLDGSATKAGETVSVSEDWKVSVRRI